MPVSMKTFAQTPRALKTATLDNLVLVPGSEFQFKQHRQELANTLPKGTTLIILPQTGKERSTLETVAHTMKSKGQPVEIRESAHSHITVL